MVAFLPGLVGLAGLGTNGDQPLPGPDEVPSANAACDAAYRPKIILAIGAGALLAVAIMQIWKMRST